MHSSPSPAYLQRLGISGTFSGCYLLGPTLRLHPACTLGSATMPMTALTATDMPVPMRPRALLCSNVHSGCDTADCLRNADAGASGHNHLTISQICCSALQALCPSALSLKTGLMAPEIGVPGHMLSHFRSAETACLPCRCCAHWL